MASGAERAAPAPKRRRGAQEEVAGDAADVAGGAARVWCDAAAQREGSGPAARPVDPELRRFFRSVRSDELLGVLAETERFWSDDGPVDDPTSARARARVDAKLALVARLRRPPRPSLGELVGDIAEMGAGSHSAAEWRAFVAEQMRLYRLNDPAPSAS